MTSIGSWLWGTSQLDDAIDKATSELLPSGQEDIALNLEICDQIRSKSAPAKDAMRALKRRLNHKNPNVQLLALSLTDICIKNGGDLFLTEVASREFMDNLVSILKMPVLNVDVKTSILKHVQNWSIAFEGKNNLGYVGQVCKTLKGEGFRFPPQDPAVANSAMVDTQIAPEWIDSDVCLRCRTAFTFTNRKHHCRNCGQVFDHQCTSKSMPLPHFGITQDVRVCDGCYNKLHKNAERSKSHRLSSTTPHPQSHITRHQADADLQRAIQLSLQEVGAVSSHSRPGYVPSQPSIYSEPPIVHHDTRPKLGSSLESEDDDPDLRAAIEASLREAEAPKPSAPLAAETPRSEHNFTYHEAQAPQPQPTLPTIPNYDLQPLEEDVILTFNQTVEQVQTNGSRDMSRYPAVNELYERANSLRPKLALNLDDSGRKEQMLTEMHERLSEAVRLYDKILTEQISHPRRAKHEQSAVIRHDGQRSSPTARSAQMYEQYPQHVWQPGNAQPYRELSERQVTSSDPHYMPYHPPPAALQSMHTSTPELVTDSYLAYTSTQIQHPSTLNTVQQMYPTSVPPTSPPPMEYMSSIPPPSSSPPLSHADGIGHPPAATTSPPHLTRGNSMHQTLAVIPNHHTSAMKPEFPQQQPVAIRPQLPQFPTAPSSTPRTMSLFTLSAPTGIPQSERKEPVLIDL